VDYFFFIIFIFFIAVVGILPFFLFYAFSSTLAFFISKVIRYRRKVVEENIKRSSLPEMSSKELNKFINNVYRNLTDVMIEGLKGFTLPSKVLLRRHKVLNPEVLDPYYEKGQSIIGVLGHYNNWEWGSLSAAKQLKHNLVALYKPFSNKLIDRYVIKIRARYGTTLASIYKTTRIFEQYVDKTTFFLMVADQSPSNARNAHWVEFLGRETAFLRGPERHAKNNNLSVFFIDIQRIKRGYYEVELSILAEDPSVLEDGEITRRYAKKLEEQILQHPDNWLWTHRRWKLNGN